MSDHHDRQGGLDASFGIADGYVAAWIESWPDGATSADDRARVMEAAVERQTGRKVKLLCRWMTGNDYRFEIL